jgi:hypothetical protein
MQCLGFRVLGRERERECKRKEKSGVKNQVPVNPEEK